VTLNEPSTDAATLSPALRTICAFNAVVWLFAQPPWFTAGALTTGGAIAGATLWALLAIGGNRAGWLRRATLAVAAGYLGLLLAKLLGDGF
jgi:hypothetical protein